MIGAAVQVMLPRPFIFERHELVHIDGAAVQKSLVLRVDTLGKIVPGRTFSWDVAAAHVFVGLSICFGENSR
jgi:hypothetical protein